MRLFIAIELPKDVLDYLYDLQKKIELGNAKVKWVAKKNIHITLKFIGHVEDSLLEGIKSRLAKVKYEKFSLKLSKTGWFPEGNSPRVIWIGVDDENSVINLQKRIDESLIDILKGEQKFNAHITIGRVKRTDKKLLESLRMIKTEEGNINVKGFSLVRSQLTRDGPRYNALERYNLS